MMMRRAAAAMIGAVALAVPVPVSAATPLMAVTLCGSGKSVSIPLDGDWPDRPGPAGCHATACLTGRAKSDGARP